MYVERYRMCKKKRKKEIWWINYERRNKKIFFTDPLIVFFKIRAKRSRKKERAT